MKPYYVYILKCADGLLYTGFTNNLSRDLNEHQKGLNENSFTYQRRPVELIFHQGFNDIDQAIYFEKKIKRWSVEKKQALANDDFDMLQILAECRNMTHSKYKPTEEEVATALDQTKVKLNTDKNELEKYLKSQNWLENGKSIVKAEKPGEGNMNFTLRITTENRSFILKQSRAYVEKYPDVPAPQERVLREAEFYEATAAIDGLKQKMPKLLHLDRNNFVMALEDLGQGKDFTFLYKNGEQLSENDLKELMGFAAALHKGVTVKTTEKRLSNRAMRELNFEHIFKFPYLENNGLNLDNILPGLQSAGNAFRNDRALQKELKKLGELYLADGDHLLHGDYFPGSWLKTSDGIKIIDPEFCFFGPPEFEIGVTLAHLKMADQPEKTLNKALEFYTEQAELDEQLTRSFMGVEILRRILGLAQLPLEIDLTTRKNLLNEARNYILK